MKHILIWSGFEEGTECYSFRDTPYWREKLKAAHTEIVGYGSDVNAAQLSDLIQEHLEQRTGEIARLADFRTGAPITISAEEAAGGVTIYFSGVAP